MKFPPSVLMQQSSGVFVRGGQRLSLANCGPFSPRSVSLVWAREKGANFSLESGPAKQEAARTKFAQTDTRPSENHATVTVAPFLLPSARRPVHWASWAAQQTGCSHFSLRASGPRRLLFCPFAVAHFPHFLVCIAMGPQCS